MRDFFRSKFFVVIVIIALVFTIIPTVLYSMGVGNAVHNFVNTALSPFQKLFSVVTESLDAYTAYFTEFDRIVAENNELRKEINELRDQIYSAEELEGMNEWLFDYLELKREHTDYIFEVANVTGGAGSNYVTVFTLDRGKSHGIKVNMPVVPSEGVVGYIVEVGHDWSKAVTLLESSSSVGVYIERTGELGVIEGDYSLRSDGLCRLSYLSTESDVLEGDRILSSGYGSVYPRGLVIGYVERVEKDASSRGVTVYVRPAANLSDISRLMVITEYETYSK